MTPSAKHFQCSICRKMFPSPESGNAHLDKRHQGCGYLTWQKLPKKARVDRTAKETK